jgi:TonB-linked SusC/RagA family outer membrane protein
LRNIARILLALTKANSMGNFLKVLLTAGCLFLLQCLQAQSIRVKGTVSDSATGKGLEQVSIAVKSGNSLTNGTLTGADGSFELLVKKGSTLVFTYVGYQEQTAVANGNAMTVQLSASGNSMEGVVVTALGIRRSEKSLGYAAQKLNENVVKDARTTNWVNSLSGKVAGLNIQGTGSGPMGSSRITLRGESSLNLNNNQALIVVDGVPVSSRITGTGNNAHLSADSPVDFGSDVSDINPDDIETITVLKGPGATALYGSRAAGGALVITTKSGARKTKGLGVTYNSSLSREQVNRWPDYQYEYGEGRSTAYYSYGNTADGINTSTTAAAGRAWGPKFNGQMYFQYDPNTPDHIATQLTPWVAQKDYISGFFQTGTTLANSIAIEGGTDKGSARLSVTHQKNTWILPNTGFERINAAFSVNQKVSDKLRITGKVNYTNKSSDNLPSAGYNNQTIMYFLILGTAPNIKPEWFKPYWKPGLTNIEQAKPFNTGPDNPYIELYEVLNGMNKNGVIGNLSADYEIAKNLNLTIRSGIDMASEFRNQQRPFSLTKYPRGMYREQTVFNYEVNTDALLGYKGKINDKFSFSASAGANAMKQQYNFTGVYADQLAQPGIYQLSNSLDPAVSDPVKSERAINSVYGFGQLSYMEKIFIDVTGRNDWSSTLPAGNNAFFYPSVSTSYLLSNLVKLPRAVSFAKLRLSWAQVGNDASPYQTDKYFDRIYNNNFTNPSTLFNPNLKPEIRSSFEAGLDLRLFNSRLGLDVSAYTDRSRNQIIAIPVDPVSGFSNALINAGLINSRGVEVVLNGKPVVSRNFNWSATVNWSLNRSYVRELAAGVPTQVIYAHNTNVTIEARPGGRMGDMYGVGFVRSPQGQVVYNSAGLPLLSTQTQKWGNAFADWKMGLLNEFSFKNFRVSILLDGQKGGSMFSQTSHKNNTLGKTKVTLPGREDGIVGDGVVLDASGKYAPNTVRVPASTYYDNYYQILNAEVNIYDCSYIKLREARIEYNLKRSILQKIGIQQTSIALYGRDLFNLTRFPGFDPEGGNLNNGTPTPGVELAQFPSARSIGINLTLKF